MRTCVLNLRIDNIVKRLTVMYRLVKRLQNTMNVLLRVLTHNLIVLLGPKYFGWRPLEWRTREGMFNNVDEEVSTGTEMFPYIFVSHLFRLRNIFCM